MKRRPAAHNPRFLQISAAYFRACYQITRFVTPIYSGNKNLNRRPNVKPSSTEPSSKRGPPNANSTLRVWSSGLLFSRRPCSRFHQLAPNPAKSRQIAFFFVGLIFYRKKIHLSGRAEAEDFCRTPYSKKKALNWFDRALSSGRLVGDCTPNAFLANRLKDGIAT